MQETDTGSFPGSGRSPGGGNSNPLQYSCLENPMDRGAWWATVHGFTKSWTRLSYACMHRTYSVPGVLRQIMVREVVRFSKQNISIGCQVKFKLQINKYFFNWSMFCVIFIWNSNLTGTFFISQHLTSKVKIKEFLDNFVRWGFKHGSYQLISQSRI